MTDFDPSAVADEILAKKTGRAKTLDHPKIREWLEALLKKKADDPRLSWRDVHAILARGAETLGLKMVSQRNLQERAPDLFPELTRAGRGGR